MPGTSTSDHESARDAGSDRAQLKRYVQVAIAWAIVFLVLPTSLKPYWYALFGWASVVVASLRVRRLPPDVRRPATIIIAAGVLSLAGGIVRTIDGIIRGVDYPFPSLADGFTLVSYALFLTAIVTIVHRRVHRFTLDPFLDAVVGGVAVAMLQWSIILIPYLQTTDAPESQQVTNIVFAGMSLLLVVAAVLALVSGSQRSTSNRLLAAGLLSTFALDLVATLVTAGHLSEDARLYVAPFVLFFGTAGLLDPSVTQLTTRPSDPTLLRRLTTKRIGVLALALIAPPVLLVVGLTRDDEVGLVLPAVASLALAPLVVTRLGRLVRQNEELAALEATLRGVGERLVSAETTEDVVRVVTVGAEQVLGTNLISAGLVTDPFLVDPTRPANEFRRALDVLERQLTDGHRATTGELLSVHVDDQHRWVAGLVVVQRELRGVLVVCTERPLSDDERNAVTALCRESAIAFRAVDHTEQQVRQRSEDRFAALIDNSSDIVAVLRNDLTLGYVSPVAQRLLGYPPQDLASIDVMGLIHRDDRAAAASMLSDIRFGLRETVEIRLRHFAGTYAWFEVVGVDLSSDPNIGGVVLNAREIGDRKMAEERLVLSEARFKALVQNSTDLVIVLDSRGGIRYASPSVEGVLHRTPEEIQGCSLDEVFRDHDLNWQDHQRGPAVNGAEQGLELVEFSFRSPEGDWHTIETTITDLRDEPAVAGFVLNARDVTYRKNMEQRLRYQSTHDELTGLANRVHVLEDLAGMLSRNSGSTTVAAMLVDIDDFKDINDSLGHAFGDQLLKAVAERITSMLDFGDVAARIGGDEFVIVLERAHGESHITDLADQVLSAIASPFVIDGRELSITASAGIVFDHDRESSGEILLRNADTAMYRAKTQGKRQIVVFEAYMHTASFDRLELRADLARAIAHEQFVAYYQPVVDMATRQIVGAEALIRWDHPRRGLLGPGLFIPLAEESGLIGPLGEWILERACSDLAAWRKEYGEPLWDFTMSVNLSVQQLHDERIVATVLDILERTGLPAERLVLEVTESTLITETDKIRSTMHELRTMGARLAVDDFGTGYSSLGYIQQFEFDVLKIDKTFVDDLERFTNQRIVTAVLDLASQLGVRTIAEGIEQELQAELLKTLGCKLGQGYLYSRPVPEDEFRELLIGEHSATTGRPVL